MKKSFLLVVIFVFLASYGYADVIFYESFDSIASVQNNGGTYASAPSFVSGKVGNAADFSGSKRVQYPQAGNLDLDEGTVQFWAKGFTNGDGLFDLGNLATTDAMALFANLGNIYLEWKSPSGWGQAVKGPYLSDWNLITST
jgi:hypothetical protein